MFTRTLLLMATLVILTACGSGGASYQSGADHADHVYGELPPEAFMSQQEQVLASIEQELISADDAETWWKGFCDRGEEIWLQRVDEINAALGHEALQAAQITEMFDQMRSSYREG